MLQLLTTVNSTKEVKKTCFENFVRFSSTIYFADQQCFERKEGLVRYLNPGPLAPDARIIPLDQRADVYC